MRPWVREDHKIDDGRMRYFMKKCKTSIRGPCLYTMRKYGENQYMIEYGPKVNEWWKM